MSTALRRVRIMAGELGLLSGAPVRLRPVRPHVRHVLRLVRLLALRLVQLAAVCVVVAVVDAGEV